MTEAQTFQVWESSSVRSYWGRIAELTRYRELLGALIRRDYLYKYRQTWAGPLWFVLQPLLMTLTFSVIFAQVGKISTQGIPAPLFFLSGLVIWQYATQSLDAVSESLRSHAAILSKVYFPRLLVPLSVVISRSFTFLLQSVLLGICYLYFHSTEPELSFAPTWGLLLVPFLLVQVACASLGLGLWVAALTVTHRDIQNFTSFFVPLWMYLTPILYASESLPKVWRLGMYLNPLAMPVEYFRYGLFGTGALDPVAAITSFSLSLTMLLTGVWAFCRVEPTFVDTI